MYSTWMTCQPRLPKTPPRRVDRASEAGSPRTGRVPAQESKRHVKIDFTQKRYLIDKFWHFHLLNEKILLRICPLKTGKGDRIKYIQDKNRSAALLGGESRLGRRRRMRRLPRDGRALRHYLDWGLSRKIYRVQRRTWCYCWQDFVNTDIWR